AAKRVNRLAAPRGETGSFRAPTSWASTGCRHGMAGNCFRSDSSTPPQNHLKTAGIIRTIVLSAISTSSYGRFLIPESSGRTISPFRRGIVACDLRLSRHFDVANCFAASICIAK
ncbi:MAG TPA: hypothetical protein VGF55_32755, partial [Gemmataceae bacterium]